ncbi:hypothetical protein GCM10022210_44150 [Mucilaginibacter dorajii]|uniref:Uncharacterized protein n=1 Tax=Mucilaginibacter dorajii TaxID=692994 RepID=A0ABP7QR89_9SPHI
MRETQKVASLHKRVNDVITIFFRLPLMDTRNDMLYFEVSGPVTLSLSKGARKGLYPRASTGSV